MEKTFGADFSTVEVIRNSTEANRLDAIAYTQGNEIHFASGYNPYTSRGQEYLGHELAHVVQQAQGRVRPTHRELGYGVNSDVDLETEADVAGERAARGQKVELGSNNGRRSRGPLLQKKNAPIQLRRPLPSGAPIFDLRIDPSTVFDAFDRAHRAVMRSTGFTNVPSIHSTELGPRIREVIGGNYFRGNNFWASDWVDEGFNDVWDLGLWDVDIKAEMTMYIDNERVVHTGSGEHTSGGSFGVTRTRRETTTVGGSVEGSVGGHEGAPGATAGGTVERTREESTTIASTGEGKLSMALPSEARRADVLIECKVYANPTIGGVRYRYWTARGSGMEAIYGGVAGASR